MSVDIVAVSHRGRVRARNEDTIAVGPWVAHAEVTTPVTLHGVTLPFIALVCDGLGGHTDGNVASRLAAQTIVCAAAAGNTDPAAAAVRWISAANSALYAAMAATPELTGMGSTVAGVYVAGEEIVVFGVGDSRVYRWQDEFLCQISIDDTLGEGADQALSQCLGGRRDATDVLPHVQVEKWLPGRGYLICSDGLYNALSLDSMEQAMHAPIELAATRLLEGALAAGAPDNVSFILLADKHE